MFQARQVEEINPLIEHSFAAMTPGAVGGTNTVGVSQAFTLSGGTPATFALGDQLEIAPSSGANTNGINVSASPTATAGTAYVNFTNATGGSVTPTAGASYRIVATRFPATLVT